MLGLPAVMGGGVSRQAGHILLALLIKLCHGNVAVPILVNQVVYLPIHGNRSGQVPAIGEKEAALGMFHALLPNIVHGIAAVGFGIGKKLHQPLKAAALRATRAKHDNIGRDNGAILH